jgi:hypothetical protein
MSCPPCSSSSYGIIPENPPCNGPSVSCVRSNRAHGWLLLESHRVSYGKATPYVPIRDFLKANFQLEAQDDGARVRAKLTGKLLTLDEALTPTLPALFTLLDVAVEERDRDGRL